MLFHHNQTPSKTDNLQYSDGKRFKIYTPPQDEQVIAWSVDSDNEIWICHKSEDDFCSKNYQILRCTFNYLKYIEELTLEILVSFFRGQKDWRWVTEVHPDGRCQITSFPSKTGTTVNWTIRILPTLSVLEEVRCRQTGIDTTLFNHSHLVFLTAVRRFSCHFSHMSIFFDKTAVGVLNTAMEVIDYFWEIMRRWIQIHY